jgi:hypothetical protein
MLATCRNGANTSVEIIRDDQQEAEFRDATGSIDSVLAEIIDSYLDHAQTATDPAESWQINATVHLHHGAGGTCDDFCRLVPLPLPNVGQVLEAQREVDEWFAEHPPVQVPFNQWPVVKVAEADDTVFYRFVEP